MRCSLIWKAVPAFNNNLYCLYIEKQGFQIHSSLSASHITLSEERCKPLKRFEEVKEEIKNERKENLLFLEKNAICSFESPVYVIIPRFTDCMPGTPNLAKKVTSIAATICAVPWNTISPRLQP